ncbi:MAG TPA: hypothetical protein VHT23_04585 [Gemmatimonadaceae bacterium]|jgi:hypothetical protein|nr:hypothetical protein [Gemmatimonadaceae bacterium]
MTRIADHRSIISIDPGSRGLTFVFFEDGMLLDWGTWRDDGNEVGLLDRLLERSRADVLILENGEAVRSERRPRMRRLLRLLAQRAEERGVVVAAISRYEVRKAWAARGMTTKHAVASAIGTMFPEIQPLVPRKRKVYCSEQARADVFDAASLVLHAYGVDTQPTASDWSVLEVSGPNA